ncbi:MAG: hypothetical protein IJO64_02260 [Clostridia bacterium]|nr:hypothetical protein [Clostridia bacterium]
MVDIKESADLMLEKPDRQITKAFLNDEGVYTLIDGRLDFSLIVIKANNGYRDIGAFIPPEFKKTVRKKRNRETACYKFGINNDIFAVYNMLKKLAFRDGVVLGKLFLYDNKNNRRYDLLDPLIEDAEGIVRSFRFTYSCDYNVVDFVRDL